MTEKEKMLAQQLYMSDDDELVALRRNARRLTRLYNETAEDEHDRRTQILRELLGAAGENVYIEPTFRCDYGENIFVGDNFYANFDCIILDVARVIIGNNVFFAPRVGVYTATHPIDAGVRNMYLEFGKEIKIGDNVWIGANAVINPGVTIGSNVIVGSGAVVVKDIPDDVIAVGNPCKVLRPITQEDKKFWERKRDEYYGDCRPKRIFGCDN